MKLNISFWIKTAIINLLIVALIGVIMRYKIGFSFPYVDQKNLLHAHTNLAFTGWINQVLITLIIFVSHRLHALFPALKFKIYLIINLITALGMVVSFTLFGYNGLSIFFITVNLLNLFAFTIHYFIASNNNKSAEFNYITKWFKAGLILGIISSLATFYFVYMMVTEHIHQKAYLASLYFYLHFQYNGYFFFACMGLAAFMLKDLRTPFILSRYLFPIFIITVIPCYLLSVLWWPLPQWLFIVAVVATIAQFIGWLIFLVPVLKNRLNIGTHLSKLSAFLFSLVLFAFTTKFILQLGSNIPSMSQLAFGFRPIVIAYLHLVLLACVSLFLVTYLYAQDMLQKNNLTIKGIIVFTGGVFLNEFVLLVQGVASFSYFLIPYSNEALLLAALVILAGVVMMVTGQKRINNQIVISSPT